MMLAGFAHLWRTLRAVSPNTRHFLAGTFLMGIGHGAAWVHLNLFLREAGLGEAVIGRVLSASSVGVALVSLPAAMWVDRFRAERIFLLAAGGFAALFAAELLVPRPLVLMTLGCLSGMLFTVHWVAAAPFFMRNEPEERRTELFGISSALETLATVISAFGVGYLARHLSAALGSELAGIRASLLAAAAVSLLAVVPFARIRSRPFGTGDRGWRDYVLSPHMKLILKLAIPGFLIGCGAGLTIPFLNLYFRERFHQDPAAIGFYFSVAQMITMFGFLAGPILARRFGHVRAAVTTELLSIPFFFILAVTGSLWVAVGAFWMRGALMNMNQPISNAFAMEIVPEDQQTATNSVRTFLWNFAWMVMTPLGGWLIERHGFAPNMYVTIGLYLAGATLFWAFFRGRLVVSRPALMALPVEAGERD